MRCSGLDAPARSMSGGNVQKLILGRALITEPTVIVANQPTWGLDIGAVSYVHSQLLAARNRGAAVVLISEDLDELFAIADRIAVMFHGTLVGGAARLDHRRDRPGDGGRRGRACVARCASSRARGCRSRSPRGADRRGRVHAAAVRSAHRLGRRAGRARLHSAVRRRVRLALRDRRDADARDAVDPHRARRGGRVPRALLQHRRRGTALSRRARCGRRRRRCDRRTVRRAVSADDRRRHARRCVAAAGSGAGQVAARRRRSRHHAAAQLRRAAVRVDDAGRPDEGSHLDGLAAVGRDRAPSSSSASCWSARACIRD